MSGLYDMDSYTAGFAAGLGKHHDERQALAAKLARAEGLLREWLAQGVEYAGLKYALTQVDPTLRLETETYFAASAQEPRT